MEWNRITSCKFMRESRIYKATENLGYGFLGDVFGDACDDRMLESTSLFPVFAVFNPETNERRILPTVDYLIYLRMVQMGALQEYHFSSLRERTIPMGTGFVLSERFQITPKFKSVAFDHDIGGKDEDGTPDDERRMVNKRWWNTATAQEFRNLGDYMFRMVPPEGRPRRGADAPVSINFSIFAVAANMIYAGTSTEQAIFATKSLETRGGVEPSYAGVVEFNRLVNNAFEGKVAVVVVSVSEKTRRAVRWERVAGITKTALEDGEVSMAKQMVRRPWVYNRDQDKMVKVSDPIDLMVDESFFLMNKDGRKMFVLVFDTSLALRVILSNRRRPRTKLHQDLGDMRKLTRLVIEAVGRKVDSNT